MGYADWFTGGVTFVVGLVALLVFYMQRRAEKRAAATILVMDIRHCELVISTVLERNSFDLSMGKPVGFSNWEKTKHLFANDLSSDDFAAFNRFFLAGSEIAGAREDMRKIFMAGLEGKASAIQELLCGLNYKSVDYAEKREVIILTANQESYVFDPDEPKGRIIRNLQVMGRLTQNPGFAKLKKFAGMKVLF